MALRLMSVARPSIVGAEPFLIAPVDRLRRIVSWAAFNLLPRDVQRHQPTRPLDLPNRIRRDQDLFSGPPIPCVDDDVLDTPADVVHEQVLHVTDDAVNGMNMIPCNRVDAAKMWIAAARATV